MTAAFDISRAILLVLLIAAAVSGSRASAADEPTLTLPPRRLTYDYYPAVARRLAIQGRAIVEFAISAKGRAEGVNIVQSEPEGVFEQVIGINFGYLRFKVPSTWGAAGETGHRFRVNVLFLLRPCIKGDPCQELAPFDPGDTITFIGSPIKRA